MIQRISVQNFKCLRDVDVELGRFNVLIGPNDSGKSTFLQAVRVVCACAEQTRMPNFNYAAAAGSVPFLAKIAESTGLTWDARLHWRTDPSKPVTIDTHAGQEEQSQVFSIRYLRGSASLRIEDGAPVSEASVGRAAMVALSPAMLRRPGALTRDTFALPITGEGLSSFLEDILLADRELFGRLEQALYERFTQYQRISLERQGGTVYLFFVTRHGEKFPAENVSDGALLYLAFLALTHRPDPPQVLLIEEPENGVHHAGLREIVQTLRDFSQTQDVQVLMTTHSPYLLDLVEPEEVLVFSKDEEGAAHARRLTEYPDAQEMKKHFMTGEIWTMLSRTEGI